MTRRLSLADVTSVITLACAALALWVSFGALSFVDVDSGDSRGTYVGILPSWTWLASLLVAAAAFAIVIRPTPRALAPLWLSAVLLLPWLPLPLPLSVLVWTGPIVYWVWIVIAAALAAEHGWRVWRQQVRRTMDPTTQVLLAGALAAVALGLGTWAVAPQHPDGDEPHYLVITQSIVADRDLRIENNHRQGDYHAYVTRTLKPDFIKRGKNGEIYSIHAPGLPLVVAPAFAIGGYRGVLVALCLIGAAASALVWLVAWRVTADAAASWFSWAVFALSVPFFFHASAVFPDGLGAAVVVAALLPLVDARAREPRHLVAVGGALALLPWLSTRFVPLAVMSALVIAARLAPDRSRLGSRLVALALVPVMSAAALFLFYQVIYGTPNPSVVYGGAPTMRVSAGTLVRGLPGLLFDQQFGLLPNAPVYLCAFAGLIVMIARGSVGLKPDTAYGGRRLALELLVIAVPYVLLAASFPLWWGGTSAPARYIAPIAPLLAVPAAVWFATTNSIVARTATMAALLVSLMMTATIASVDRGAFLFNFRDGMSRIALWLSPVADLTKALPSLFQNTPSIVLLQTAVWLAAVAVAVAAAMAVGRRGRIAVILAFGLTLQVASTAAVSLVWRSNGASIATPHAAGPALLTRYDPEASQIAVAYRPFQTLEPADIPGRLVLVSALTSNSGAAPVSARRLPAGIYEVAGTTAGAPGGRLQLKIDPLSTPIADWDVASFGPSWKRQLVLPVAVAALLIDADATARGVVKDVSMRAVSVSTPQKGLENRIATEGARYGPVAVFLIGGDAWVEPGGIWVAGGSNAELAIAPDRQSPIQLSIHSGPVDNQLTLESGTWRERFALKAGEGRVLQLPTDGRSLATPLKVTAASGFRPVDVDPESEDERFLGVRIETR